MDMNLGKLWESLEGQGEGEGKSGEGQGSLACCSPWGCKELDTTWQLNNNKDPIRFSVSGKVFQYHLSIKTRVVIRLTRNLETWILVLAQHMASAS